MGENIDDIGGLYDCGWRGVESDIIIIMMWIMMGNRVVGLRGKNRGRGYGEKE